MTAEWDYEAIIRSVLHDDVQLLQLQKTIEREGKICGTTHRYLIAARKNDRSETCRRER